MRCFNNKPFFKTILLLYAIFLGITLSVSGQGINKLNKPAGANHLFSLSALDTTKHKQLYATRQQTKSLSKPAGSITQGVQDCSTSTFYMHIPAQPGQKINLHALQTLPGGDYFAAGSITDASGNKQGLILRISNAGTVVIQKNFQVNSSPADIYSAKVLTDGTVLIGGALRDGKNAAFVALLNADISINWLKVFAMPNSPINVKVDVTDGAQFSNGPQYTFGVQFSKSVVCILLNNDQSIAWARTVIPVGLTNLVALSNMPDGSIGLIANCIQSGKHVTEFTELAQPDGSIATNYLVGSDESNFYQANVFNGRLNMIGIFKAGTSFQFERNLSYYANTIETHHTYQIPGNIDFGTSAALDNAGDALGFSLPNDGKMIFIKQFASSQTTPEYTREYVVPKIANMAGIARSYDGGYIFGVNTKDSGEVILIKTDSVGVVAGCGYTNIANNFTETSQIANNTANAPAYVTVIPISNGIAPLSDIALVPTFDCKQYYCPAAPTQDTCLSTYYKVLRSNSYSDAFGRFYVMRNNMQLGLTARYDRILGDGNMLSYGLKLFDERGNFVKGVDMFSNGVSVDADIRQIDDKTIMLNMYSVNGSTPQNTFTLVSDDLQILWSKTITATDFGGSSDGSAATDWIKDAEGNYYYVTCGPGFDSPSKIYALKMDASGNVLWTEGFTCNVNQNFASVSAIATNSSIILVIDAYSGQSATVNLDKGTGQLLNSFFYQTGGGDGGAVYHRFASYTNGIILYASNTKDDYLLLGVFDSTGRPVKLKSFNQASLVQSGAASNGKMYVLTGYFNLNGATTPTEVLLEVDTGLNTVHATGYVLERPRAPRGLGVGSNGYIYTGGNYSYGGVEGSYYDPYIIKYDSSGKLGSCGTKIPSLPVTDIDPQTQINSDLQPITASIQANTVPFELQPDNDGQAVAGILCSSTPECNYIKVTGQLSACKLDTGYTYKIGKNALCTITPSWIYDTAYTAISNTTDTSITFTFKKTGNILLKATLNEGCNLYSDSILVKVQKAPASFSLGKDTLVCAGDSIKLDAGTGFNTYLWQDGSTDSIFIVKQAGQYFVQVSNVCGDKYADTVSVSAAVVPPLTITNNPAVCLADTVQLQASAGFAVYKWQPANVIIGQGQYVAMAPKSNTTIILNAVTNNGCKATDSATVKVITARAINLGADTSFCAYDSLTLNAGTGYQKYLWSNGRALHLLT